MDCYRSVNHTTDAATSSGANCAAISSGANCGATATSSGATICGATAVALSPTAWAGQSSNAVCSERSSSSDNSDNNSNINDEGEEGENETVAVNRRAGAPQSGTNGNHNNYVHDSSRQPSRAVAIGSCNSASVDGQGYSAVAVGLRVVAVPPKVQRSPPESESQARGSSTAQRTAHDTSGAQPNRQTKQPLHQQEQQYTSTTKNDRIRGPQLSVWEEGGCAAGVVREKGQTTAVGAAQIDDENYGALNGERNKSSTTTTTGSSSTAAAT
eukprot:Lankesteria_metandrocarpae@DN6498_c0_g1_i1.p1